MWPAGADNIDEIVAVARSALSQLEYFWNIGRLGVIPEVIRLIFSCKC